MSKRKNLKAYVRLDKNRKPVPGSLIYRKDKPYGKFAPMLDPSGDICCAPTPSGCAGDLWISELGEWNGLLNGSPSYSAVTSGCNTVTIGAYNRTGNPQSETAPFLLGLQGDGTTLNFMKREAEDNYSPYDWPIFYFKTDSLGNIIAISETRVFKYDSSGNYIWGKVIEELPEYSYVYISGLDVDSNDNIFLGVTFGGKPTNPQSFVAIIKLSSTGTLLNQTTFTLFSPQYSQAVTTDTYGGLIVNNNGDIYIATTSSNAGVSINYRGVVHRFDSNLTWMSSFDVNLPATSDNQYRSIDKLAKDSQGNILFCINGYGLSSDTSGDPSLYVKYDPLLNDFAWTMKARYVPNGYNIGLMDICTDPIGNLYCTAGNIQNFGNTYGPNRGKAVLKISKDGVAEWAYLLESTVGKDIRWYWGYSPSGMSMGDGVLVGSNFFDGDNSGGFVYNLPLTTLDGVYGNYLFTDNTSDITTIPYSYTLTSHTIVDMEETVTLTDSIAVSTDISTTMSKTPIV